MFHMIYFLGGLWQSVIITSIGLFYNEVGRLWRLSDLWRIKWGLLTGDEWVGFI